MSIYSIAIPMDILSSSLIWKQCRGASIGPLQAGLPSAALDNSVSPATIAFCTMVMPKVSIVTPSFNQARYLPLTLQCVREQDYPDIEHIVVDGGSTDGTLDILRGAPGIRWGSEHDHGQVDAWGKGRTVWP